MQEQLDKIFVVDRASIPFIDTVAPDAGKAKPGEPSSFSWREHLERFMPPASELAISWVALKHDEVLEPRARPSQSMMIVYRGSGRLLGKKSQPIGAGDVIVVPPGCEHGFAGGPEGLYALSVEFGGDRVVAREAQRAPASADEYGLDQLVAHNESRLEELLRSRFFTILRDGTLADPKRRDAFLGALQVWLDGNQTLLFACQASCREPAYRALFCRHLQARQSRGEEGEPTDLGVTPVRDPALDAIAGWFSYQMLVLDNIEKVAVVNLVIERAYLEYQRVASLHQAGHPSEEASSPRVDAGGDVAVLGEQLLRDQDVRTYRRLEEISDEAWDMLGAMMERIAEMTLEA